MKEITEKSRKAIEAFIKNPTKSRLIAIYELDMRDGRASGPCMTSDHLAFHHNFASDCKMCPLGAPAGYGSLATCCFSNLRENLRKPGAWEETEARVLKALIEFQAGII